MTFQATGRKPIVEMNLIPLIDVSLILVIIFMVLTPILIHSQLTVKLPKAETGAPSASPDTVNVQIDRRGNVSIDGSAVRWGGLERELVLRLGKSAKKTVLVQADKSVAVDKVVAVLDISKKLGVAKLGIGVTAEAP
ncbi:MAG: biopolymer transporter ExbD [Elusimicrobia bacterium]|nr:biopolymer transporter ExbD [Elusimicrobiota bacterium]